MPEHSDLFADPEAEIQQLKAYIEELQRERPTATPERQQEIGWCIFGATKHLGRLMDVNLARSRGEHRFIIHESDGEREWAVCSCGAKFPGLMHEDFTLEEFPRLPGHNLSGQER